MWSATCIMMCRASKRKPAPWDDGTRVADMNVDGMPWVTRKQGGLPGSPGSPRPPGAPGRPNPGESAGRQAGDKPDPPLLSGRETWRLIINALGAAMLIGLVFALGALLFILFCLYVWFR